jgi:hypothetical protein
MLHSIDSYRQFVANVMLKKLRGDRSRGQQRHHLFLALQGEEVRRNCIRGLIASGAGQNAAHRRR